MSGTSPTPMRARFGLEILSGNLDLQSSIITTTVSNGNISIQPASGGHILLGGLSLPTTLGTNHYGLMSDGSGNLSWSYMVSDLSTFTTDNLAQGLSSDRKYFSDSLFGTSLALRTTDNLSQGTTNLYWSQTLFDTAFGNKSTNNLTEGSNHLYWTQTRFNTAFGAETTTNLAEGTNLYWTSSRFNAAIGNITSDAIAQGTTNLYFNTSYFNTAFEAQSIGNLSDVSLSSPTNNDGLVYNGTASKWENKALGSAAFLNVGTSANNLVQLTTGGLLPTSVLPPLAISDVYVVADDTARNALTVHTGDVCKVTADGKTYIYDGTTWQEIIAYNLVSSVNSLTGAVVLTSQNIDGVHTPINYTIADSTLDSYLSGIDTALGKNALSDLSDVAISSPTTSQMLIYSSGKWRNAPEAVEDTAIIYVNSLLGKTGANGATGTMNYPYNTISEAITNGATRIHVAGGTYTESVSISSGTIQIDGPEATAFSPLVTISGKFSISGGSVKLNNVILSNSGTHSTDFALYISGCSNLHEFNNVYITRPGQLSQISVEIDGLAAAYTASQTNVMMTSCNIDATLQMTAQTIVTISGNASNTTVIQNISTTNSASGTLNIFNWSRSGLITHIAGILNIDGLKNIQASSGICIASTAMAQTYNYLKLRNVNTFQSDGSQGVVYKTGTCVWDSAIFTRNVAGDSFLGNRNGVFDLHADDVTSDIQSGDITHYTPFGGASDLNSHLKGIDSALGSIDTSLGQSISITGFQFAGDLIVGTGTHTYTILQRGNNNQILASNSTGISWVNPPQTFTDPLTTPGDLLYRDTTGLSGTTTRLPIGTTGKVLTVINHDAGQIGWQSAPVLEDESSPTLGGDLNVFDGITAHKITTSQPNGNVVIQSNGSTGHVVLDALTYPKTDGSAGYGLVTNGSGTLTFQALISSVNSISSPSITLNGQNIYGTYSPTKYTIADKKLDSYFSGLDNFFGAIPGTSITVPTATNWTTSSNPPNLSDTITAVDGALTSIKSGISDLDTTVGDMKVMTSKGDMIYSPNNYGDFARLSIGTSSQVLQVANGIPTWSSQNWITDPTNTDGDMIMRISGQVSRFPAGNTYNGDVLQVVSGIPTWTSHNWITDPTTTAGDLIYRNSSNVIDRLPSGGALNAGYVLTVVSGIPTWQANVWPGTTDGDMAYQFEGSPTRLAIGTFHQILQVVGGVPTWATPSFTSPMTTTGDMIYESSGGSARLGIGTSGQVLTVVSGVPAWANGGGTFNSPMTTTGDLIYESSGGPARLPVGTSGQILTVVSGVPSWAAPPVSGVSSVNTLTGSVTLNGANLTTAHTPVNYTSADTTLDSNLAGIDTVLGNLSTSVPTFMQESFTLSSTDITHGYITLQYSIINASCIVVTSGIVQALSHDYTLSVVNSVTRVTFSGDLATNLVSGNIVYVMYSYGSVSSNNNNNSSSVAVNSSTSFTMSSTNQVIIQKVSANSTVTLVNSSSISSGKTVTIKDGNGNASTYPIVIAGNGSDTVDGQASISIVNSYESVTLIWNGSEWNII